MALSEEALKMQLDVLTSRTDQNADMVYKTNAILNKALNPDVFSGQNSKIVNAINLLAAGAQQTNDLASNVANKVNELLLDTSNDANNAIWQNVKYLMEQDTIIEGIQHILEGNLADKVLGLDVADVGKVLSVDVDENGDPILKAIDMVISGGGVPNVAEIKYVNSKVASVQNVKSALDYLFNNMGSGGGLGGGTIIGEITWDMIDDRPEVVPDNIRLADNMLQLREGTEVVSAVQLMNSKEVDDLLSNMS